MFLVTPHIVFMTLCSKELTGTLPLRQTVPFPINYEHARDIYVKTSKDITFSYFARNTKGTFRSNDVTAMRMLKKNNRFNKKNNNFAHTSHFFATFLPFLRNYNVKMPNFAFYGECQQATSKSYFSLWAWIWFLGIQLQFGSPTINKVSA